MSPLGWEHNNLTGDYIRAAEHAVRKSKFRSLRMFIKLQHRVADIVRQVQFAPNCTRPALWDALRHYQQKEGSVDKSAPIDFLSHEQRAALTGEDGKFRVSLYKGSAHETEKIVR